MDNPHQGLWRTNSKDLTGITQSVATKSSIVVLSGSSHKILAAGIAEELGVPLCAADIKKNSAGETIVSLIDTVREKDVFIIQPTAYNPNESLMELLIIIDAIKRASSKRIIPVITCFGYARQDKKERSRVPISAKLVANLLERAGADRILTVDLHMNQLQGFFNIPVDNLYCEPMLVRYIQENIKEDKVMVAPGVGGVLRAKRLADRLGVSLSIIHFGSIVHGGIKEDIAKENKEDMKLVGDVRGKVAIMIEDLVDTCTMETEMANTLIQEGATKVYLVATHAIVSGDAIEKINRSKIHQVIVTDTLPTPMLKKCEKIVVMDVSFILARAIRIIHDGENISSLFTEDAT
eukprot:TRINITY_DN1121_c0_g1_i1.p1 TRINITY_DN1121_c0_g1~~TRINITY_DN1121_c0_g1_i1.p1  ORF type:complete len:350 (+),score=99.06 TRINITY_DN1121_c0_g1_i1:142-1191(+)